MKITIIFQGSVFDRNTGDIWTEFRNVEVEVPDYLGKLGNWHVVGAMPFSRKEELT